MCRRSASTSTSPRQEVSGLRRPAGILVALLLLPPVLGAGAFAQIERWRANPSAPVDELFWSPTVVITSSVTNFDRGDLNFSIMHAFGIATNGVEDLFGLDGAANIRFGLDYGITNRFSVGFGRQRFERTYDARFKLNVLRQTSDNRVPLEFALQGVTGITTDPNGYELVDRLSFAAVAMLGRRMNSWFAFQISPMYSHLNTVIDELLFDGTEIHRENDHYAVAFAVHLRLAQRVALVAEYVPVFGPRSDDTVDAMAVGIDLETGGHVFQMFVTTSQWFTPQHLLAKNVDDFLDGDFRIGFNVNRVF